MQATIASIDKSKGQVRESPETPVLANIPDIYNLEQIIATSDYPLYTCIQWIKWAFQHTHNSQSHMRK